MTENLVKRNDENIPESIDKARHENIGKLIEFYFNVAPNQS